MQYQKKTFAYRRDGKLITFAGHIKRETAIKRGFVEVCLAIVDWSGKGRGEVRRYYSPEFDGMQGYH